MRRLFSPVLLGLISVACSADSATDAVSLSYGMQPAPFVGSCKLLSEPPQPIGPGVISQVDTGECTISHLGKSTYTSAKVIDFVAGTQTFQGMYVAANGDVLNVSGNGTNQLVAPGRVAFTAQMEFQGGTGRFADASGSATIEGEADVVNRRSQFTASGSIAY